jgi:phospholipid/cholesterol/gamma-HCH transport system substrate-binding protein
VFFVRVNFANVEGVKPGAAVMLSGYNVGTVSEITLTPGADSIRLLLRIDYDIRKFIKKDSQAEIKQEGLVGNKFISVSIGSPKAKQLDDFGYIHGVPPFALSSIADNFISIADTVKQVSGELNTLLHRLNQGEGTIGKLLTDDEVYQRFVNITAQTEEGLRRTNQQLDKLSGLLSNSVKTLDAIAIKADTAMDNTVRMTESAASILQKVNDGDGTIGLLMNDRALYDSLTMFLNVLSDVTFDAGNAADQAAKSIHAMREHWLFGRIFAGDDFEQEQPVQSSYVRKMRELQQRLKEIERREAELGIQPEGTSGRQGTGRQQGK